MTQAEALAILKTGANVFLTGEPGSGKTHTINQYVAYLRSCGIEPAITASTGIAATHIHGRTIHSWSGIGVRRDITSRDLDALAQNERLVRRIRDTHVLIIDEVSMLSATTLAMVDAVCREIKGGERSFGGVQVVLVGDFFQLPPVVRGEENDTRLFENASANKQFSFHSDTWSSLSPLTCYLSEQYRQEDAAFLDLLSAIRSRRFREDHRMLLRTRYARMPRANETQLFSHNENVDRINAEKLASLDGEQHGFVMTTRGPKHLVEQLLKGCLSPERLELKVGAHVMFTRNDIEWKYVNGTMGEVIGFGEESGYPLVRTTDGRTIPASPDEWRIEDGGKVLARLLQVPLRLAWAITVHKSQGMSLDAAHMDLSDTFEYGQGYVALSRVRTLAGLSLAGLNQKALEVHPEIRTKDEEFRKKSLEAREKFNLIAPQELAAMHSNFVRACGGKPGMGRASAISKNKTSTYEATKELVAQKLSLKDMAKQRGLTVGTIIDHLEKLAARKSIDPLIDLAHIERDPVRFEEMKKALDIVYEKEKQLSLGPARTILGEAYSYDELRLTRLFIKF